MLLLPYINNSATASQRQSASGVLSSGGVAAYANNDNSVFSRDYISHWESMCAMCAYITSFSVDRQLTHFIEQISKYTRTYSMTQRNKEPSLLMPCLIARMLHCERVTMLTRGARCKH
jgi:hypothetical protein